MENLHHLISQLEAAETNVSDVSVKLRRHLLELEIHAKDYDFIKNDSDLKSKLLMHYRRMMAHESSLIQEKESLRFENICRHAHIQMEGLLAYFYKEKFKCIAPQFIAEHNRYIGEVNEKLVKLGRVKLNPMPTDKSWSRITFAEKNFLFQKYTLDERLAKFLKLTNNFRNTISHIGYVDKHSEPAVEIAETVKVFAAEKNVNAVFDALFALRDYVANW